FQIKQLCGLCGPYVDALEIHETICSEASNGKIPLHALLTGLEHLKMLSLRFKQTYAKDEFSWNTVTTSYQDMSLLAKGLQNIRLQELRLTDSDIDCDKAIIILKALCKHDLAVLDLSHCKIGDRGAVAIARFTTLCPVRELYLVNNRIGKYTIRPLLMGHPNLLIANLARNSGTKGVKSLAYAVAQEGCELHHLDLHLNHVSDQAGNILLASLVKYNQSLKSILLSSCSLTNHFQIARALKHRNCIERLDVSNNALGEDTGLELLRALKSNSTLRKLDVRMCKISSSTEAGIQHEVHKNRIGWSKDCASESVEDVAWDDILKAEIENALITTQGFND
ncbi:dynein regulatory complex subunit 5, partial [Dendroctonus ponderosae]|uniref:dynein regulatory complex subunit 5 n=1 Tax=Dendroctonus ponderosae TaxID=77166 RepID=UPI0020363976